MSFYISHACSLLSTDDMHSHHYSIYNL